MAASGREKHDDVVQVAQTQVCVSAVVMSGPCLLRCRVAFGITSSAGSQEPGGLLGRGMPTRTRNGCATVLPSQHTRVEVLQHLAS